MVQEDMEQRIRKERLEVITLELRSRIRPVCETMPDDMFLEMIEQMAAIQLKYEILEKQVSP